MARRPGLLDSLLMRNDCLAWLFIFAIILLNVWMVLEAINVSQ